MPNMRTGFIRCHVLQEGMYYWRTCCSEGHVFLENMLWEDVSFRRTCLTVKHVLWEIMYYGVTCLMRGYVLQEEISYNETYHKV